jgi:hypothetical protein
MKRAGLSCWVVSLALAGCTVGGLTPVEDPSLTEGQKNLAAIRAILTQPPYTSTGVPAENTQRGSGRQATSWPPEWLTKFVSPGPVESSTTADSFVSMPAASTTPSPKHSSSGDLGIKIPRQPSDTSIRPGEPYRPVPPYTILSPLGPPTPGGGRCVPDYSGGQRCRPN